MTEKIKKFKTFNYSIPMGTLLIFVSILQFSKILTQINKDIFFTTLTAILFIGGVTTLISGILDLCLNKKHVDEE